MVRDFLVEFDTMWYIGGETKNPYIRKTDKWVFNLSGWQDYSLLRRS
jgi:hypothetical protein